jgi:hypothetical protein
VDEVAVFGAAAHTPFLQDENDRERPAVIQISARMSMIMSAVFAAICGGVAISGFTSLGDIADPAQMADAKGFAWFWTFLALISVVFGALSWWMSRSEAHADK